MIKTFNESETESIKESLEWLENTPFSRASISKRCLTIKGMTFVYDSSHYQSIDEDLDPSGRGEVISSERLSLANKEIHIMKEGSKVSIVLKVPPATR